MLSGLVACAGQRSAVPEPATESPAARFAKDPAAVERGRLLFIGTCGAYCHATHDEEREAPSLFDCTWRHGGSDAEVFHSIAEGVPGTRMPGWVTVLPKGEEDIWRVIAYLRVNSVCKTQPGVAAH